MHHSRLCAVLIDWLLVLRARSLGATVRFDRTPRMIYRQHAANVAKVLPPFTAPYVLRATDLVVAHYDRVLDPAGGVSAEHRGVIHQAASDAGVFRHAIARSEELLARYVSALNALTPSYVWWWCVANPQLEDVWKN